MSQKVSKFVVHRDVVGALKHIRYELGKVSWIDDPVTSEWVFAKDEYQHGNCLKTLLKINGIETDYSPGLVQEKVYGKLLPGIKTVPWSLCLPSGVYKSSVKNFLKSLSIFDVDFSYYKNVFSDYRKIRESLQPFSVNTKIIKHLFENASDSLSVHLESFLPNNADVVPPPQYNFFGTRTGRLTVRSGPMVLTLPKEHRNIISPGKGNSILQIDFSSLEPRLLAALGSVNFPKGDFYEEMKKFCSFENLPREKSKTAILGILYGMSAETLSSHIDLPPETCREILTTVKTKLKVKETLSKIEKETVGSVCKNFFGKMIEINKQSILNNYIQSTAMDIAHMGFASFIEKMSEKNLSVKPLFLVHDALVIEIPEKNISQLNSLLSEGFYCSQLNCFFPVKIDNFAKSGQI